MFCSAGPVASFKGLWHDAQLELNIALPSGAAIAGTLHISKKTKSEQTPRKYLVINGFNDSGTGINLKINFPLYKKARQNYNTILKIYTHFVKNVSQCWSGFQRFWCYKFNRNVIFLSREIFPDFITTCHYCVIILLLSNK